MDIYGILAHPAKQSLSPAMHNAAFKELKINAEYKYFDVKPESLTAFIKKLYKLNIKGLSVSKPYKEAIIKYLDRIDGIAKKIGAVNTVKLFKGKLIGTNFDWIGVQNSLLEKTGIHGRTVVILGAGGAAAAALYAVKKNKAKNIFVLNRTISHAKELAEKFNCKYGKFKDFKDIHPDIIIQATSAGMNNSRGVQIIPKAFLKPNMVVMEMIYTPRMTRILKDAKVIGAKIITGERMLLHQGFAAFEFWTGKKAPVEIMEKAVNKRLA